MKKLSLLFVVAFMAVILFSCNKKEDVIVPQKQYASAISGQFIPKDGDINLKSAPAVGGHQINCYDKKVGQTTWSVVDGTEFLPGSAPALDWTGYAIDGAAWWFSGGVYITYCPVLPMRVILKATEGGYGTTPSYLGIWDGTPDAALFPITIVDRRLGDVLTLDTDALTALPGYTNMSFDVIYTKNIIDVNETALTSPVTTTAWPVYVYSSTSEVTKHLDATKNLVDRIVYEGLDAKITGTITIKINVDNTTITKTTPAADLGNGLKLKLSTNKVGWYNSGTIGVTENDIVITTVDVPV
ncbi:MAG TPA: hypothetical protein VGK38_12620 [Prolixibacteraceae bacterium]